MVGQQGNPVGANAQYSGSLPANSSVGMSFDQANQLLSSIFSSIDQGQTNNASQSPATKAGSDNYGTAPSRSGKKSVRNSELARGAAQEAAGDAHLANDARTQGRQGYASRSQAALPRYPSPDAGFQGGGSARSANDAARAAAAGSFNSEGARAGRLAADRPDLFQNTSAARQHAPYSTKADVPSMNDNVGYDSAIVGNDEGPRRLMQSNMAGMLRQGLQQHLQINSMLQNRPHIALNNNGYDNTQSVVGIAPLATQNSVPVNSNTEFSQGVFAGRGAGDMELFYGAPDDEDDDIDYVDTNAIATQGDNYMINKMPQPAAPQYDQGLSRQTYPGAGFRSPVAVSLPQNGLSPADARAAILEKNRPRPMSASDNVPAEEIGFGNKSFVVNSNDVLSDFRAGNFASIAFIPANLPEIITDDNNNKIMPIVLPRKIYDAIFRPRG